MNAEVMFVSGMFLAKRNSGLLRLGGCSARVSGGVGRTWAGRSRVRMAAEVIDGKLIAGQVREEVSAEVAEYTQQTGKAPGLAVVIVGTRKDSQTYVRNKRRACDKVGIASFLFELPENVSQSELVKVVDDLNNRNDVHGILVQLPLPEHIQSEEVLDTIKLEKDVDGFHPLNIGRLCMNGREKPLFIPCTPKGCIELLDRSNVPIEGKNAVVLGRSNIVGMPVSMLLMQRNATVTVCHRFTDDLENKVRNADIVVSAVGRAGLVKGDWIKPGAALIDVGINAVDDPSDKRGYRLVGDIEYEAAKERSGWITPVPGGVGPMTIAMLLRNTLEAAKLAMG
mmetsp:Transcript_14706/g.59792  ORF Transcript_14706/g.59792 Transcript_14706/m.59792 type:complete len:339 (-) Transcript_14706:243-1259(-)|eukprot:CAMPEP_0113958070 /NCGR_PEP_ID=MMETSP0011_2-20120614/3139_1 /TAXON_ID=101924 /ORGANISM="Rhodosorus marinus" /LENGTH=338 /DNA_ID=CAMNT_0000968739 /DNA_START=79 /DNA_END=1095 /DNA_ORIENTATION=+ /assembly_acc=CAM_ASM_000156